MKKVFIVMTAMLFLIGTAATALAIPFSITDSSLTIEWDGLGLGYTYTPKAVNSMVLVEGQTSDPIHFGTLTFSSLFLLDREGTATFGLTFGAPEMQGPVEQEGSVNVWRVWQSFFIVKSGEIVFEQPEQTFAYSYGGLPGGIMTLAMFDDKDSALCSGIKLDIYGTITNTKTPVAEPATALMLGAFLVGLAGISRKKLLK